MIPQVPHFSLAVETDKYLSVSNKVETDDIDWAAARAAGLSQDEVFILTYFSDIEHQTYIYMRDLMSTEAALEPDVIAFLTMWNYEEFFHGKALGRLLVECGYSVEKDRIARVHKARSLSEKLESMAATVVSKIFRKDFPAVHATWGAVQEITTLHGYEQLAEKTKNPVLKLLCERIAKQERRHFAWYFNSAREKLQRSTTAQKLTRTLLSKFWSPVGAGVKTDAEVARLVTHLFGGKRFLEISGDIDGKIASLPGLQGLQLMRPYMERILNQETH